MSVCYIYDEMSVCYIYDEAISSHPSSRPRRRSIASGDGGGGGAEASKRSLSALAKPSKTKPWSLASYAKKGQKATLGGTVISWLRISVIYSY